MSKSFLVIDDSKVSRMFIRRFISELKPDWQLSEAANGSEALQLGAQNNFDFISIDYNMPDMNGLELSQAIRELQPDSFIGLVTANIQKSTELAAQQLGLNYYKKPVTEEMVRLLVTDAENHHG
ncbi:MAG: response regulator transcription factor [Alishewanella aestuarii]